MANKLYPLFKQALLSPGLNLATATVKAVLVDTGAYTQSDAHEFLSSVPSGARIGTPQTLGSKTVTGGVFDAADVTFAAVPAGSGSASAAEAIVIYVEGANDGASRLVAFIDGKVAFEVAADAASGATSLPVEDLQVSIPSGASLTKLSGTGPTTISTSAAASLGARTIPIGALGSSVSAGAIYEVQIGGLPITSNGGDISIVWPAAGIFGL